MPNKTNHAQHKSCIFIVGAPRSGTTWLQLMLARHPAISTCQETHLFSSYLGPMHKAWRAHASDNRKTDLQAAIFYKQLLSIEQQFAKCLFDTIRITTLL